VPETVTKEPVVVEEPGIAPGYVPEDDALELLIGYRNPLDEGPAGGVPDEREVGTAPG
jgi:hypothetical protein